MYSQNYRLWKSWLENSLKSAISENALKMSTCESVQNTFQICTRAVLSFFFMVLRKFDLENVSPTVRSNLRRVFWHIDCRLQVSCSVLLELAIEISNAILWNAKTLFLDFLFHFWNVHQILNILKKKMLVIANLFPKLQTVTILVREVSKKRHSRKRFDSQHVKLSQILVKTFIRAILSCFFIILKEVDFENISPSVSLNLRGVCWQIEHRWQVSRSIFWEFATPNSNSIIWKTKHFSGIFFCIFRIYMKFSTFWKKEWWS